MSSAINGWKGWRMNYEKFDPDRHYQYLVDTWTHYNWIPIPLSFLPERGYVATQDGFVAAMFMYESKNVCFVDFAVGNPEMDKWVRGKALKEIFEMLVADAKNMGCKFIYSVTAVPAFMKMLDSVGMKKVETGMTSFVMSLEGHDASFLE